MWRPSCKLLEVFLNAKPEFMANCGHFIQSRNLMEIKLHVCFSISMTHASFCDELVLNLQKSEVFMNSSALNNDTN